MQTRDFLPAWQVHHEKAPSRKVMFGGRTVLSPTYTLIDTVVGGRLYGQIPVRLDRNTLIHLRITTVVPQQPPARRGYVWGLGIHPDVIQYLPRHSSSAGPEPYGY
jgi:hypothetical protein